MERSSLKPMSRLMPLMSHPACITGLAAWVVMLQPQPLPSLVVAQLMCTSANHAVSSSGSLGRMSLLGSRSNDRSPGFSQAAPTLAVDQW